MAATAAQNRLFLVSLGVTTFVVIRLMRRMLLHYRDCAVIPQTEGKPQYITQDVEDSLKLSTLNKLLDSPNYSIQETTAVIICERALHDDTTLDALLYHITRPDHDIREKGIRALTMMINNSNVGKINLPKTYAALVRSLEYCVTDYEHIEYDSEWDNWNLRDVVEQYCLLVLYRMVDKFGVEGLTKSKFVERWLVKEPWGGTDEGERQINFMESLTKEYKLTQILLLLWKDPKGRQQLEEAKLLPPSQIVGVDLDAALDIKMTNGEETVGEELGGDVRRRRDQSSEEEHLRRRHREAMVLNDGTRPLGRADIIERAR